MCEKKYEEKFKEIETIKKTNGTPRAEKYNQAEEHCRLSKVSWPSRKRCVCVLWGEVWDGNQWPKREDIWNYPVRAS